MPKSSDELDWKNSPSHFNLLLAFDKPRELPPIK